MKAITLYATSLAHCAFCYLSLLISLLPRGHSNNTGSWCGTSNRVQRGLKRYGSIWSGIWFGTRAKV